jgi:hypothetical protein
VISARTGIIFPPKGISDIPCHQFSIKKQPYPYIALPWSLSKKKKSIALEWWRTL